jgi:hypothetical protein
MPRRDVWGEAIPNVQGVIPGVLSIYEQRINNDPVNLALLKIGVFPGKLDRKIRNIDLTPQEYDDFQRLAGRMAKSRLDVFVRSPEFQTWTPALQHDLVSVQIAQAREAARNVMMLKFPHIVRDATQAKQARLHQQ